MSPKSLVLDLLRVTPGHRAVAVRSLVEIGALFGFNANAVRVAVARLVASGALESDERGSYRIAPRAAAVSEFADEWRRGADRTRPWNGNWIALAPPRAGSRADRRRGHRAMQRLGFADGLAGLWVRPDNLALSRDALAERLRGLGLAAGAELFTISDTSRALADRWSALWPVDELRARCRDARRDLERSAARVPSMPLADALVETFLLGGAAIRALALDPLLPDEILPGDERLALTDAMLDYDELGRATWARLIEQVPLSGAPSHLGAMRGLHV